MIADDVHLLTSKQTWHMLMQFFFIVLPSRSSLVYSQIYYKTLNTLLAIERCVRVPPSWSRNKSAYALSPVRKTIYVDTILFISWVCHEIRYGQKMLPVLQPCLFNMSCVYQEADSHSKMATRDVSKARIIQCGRYKTIEQDKGVMI